MQVVISDEVADVLFGYRLCPKSTSLYRDYQNLTNDVMTYLALNRNISSDSSSKDFLVEFYGLDKNYSAPVIADNAREDSASLIIYYGTSFINHRLATLTGELLGDWQEMNTASCPLSQYLTSKSIGSAKAYMRTREDGTHQSFVYVEYVDSHSGMFGRIISAIPRLIPDIFTDEKVSEDEKQLFKFISEHNFDKATNIIETRCSELKIHELAIRKQFEAYENIVVDSQKERLRQRLERLHRECKELETAMAEKTRLIATDNATYESLCNANKDGRNFVDFILSRKNITHIERHSDSFRYAVDETIDYFDEDAFERYYRNPHCSWLSSVKHETKKILEGLFLKRLGKLRVYGEFDCDSLSSIDALKASQFSTFDYANHFKHPHLGNYACLGSNGQPIREYLLNGDWDLAIEQTIAATKNLNFGDSVVMETFTKQLDYAFSSSSKDKYIVANDGQEMTLQEFYVYVQEKEKQEEEKAKNEQTN